MAKQKPSIAERRKTIDINTLPENDIDRIALELGKKLGTIAQEAEDKGNELAKIYGMRVRMTLCFVDQNGNPIIG